MPSLQLRQEIRQSQKTVMAQILLETIGDIPLFSLHRIQTVWKKKSPAVSEELSRMFLRYLFEQNEKFKELSGKQWNCINLHHLQHATSDTGELLSKMISEHASGIASTLEMDASEFDTLKIQEIGKITAWFEENYDDILYNTNSKLPRMFIMYLKMRLGQWRGGIDAAFDQEISDVKNEFNLPDF